MPSGLGWKRRFRGQVPEAKELFVLGVSSWTSPVFSSQDTLLVSAHLEFLTFCMNACVRDWIPGY